MYEIKSSILKILLVDAPLSCLWGIILEILLQVASITNKVIHILYVFPLTCNMGKFFANVTLHSVPQDIKENAHIIPISD